MEKFITVSVIISVFIGCIYAVPARNIPAYGLEDKNQQSKEVPQPYSFEYKAADEEGNAHHRSEEGDGKGSVKGAYGYTDVHGLYRVVEYVADEKGYRAIIKTNEPGVDGKESPADVSLSAEQPPAGVQEIKASPSVDKVSAPAPRRRKVQPADRPVSRPNRY